MVARKRSTPGSVLESPARAYIGLGSNLNAPLIQIRTALQALDAAHGIALINCSAVYRNQAMLDVSSVEHAPQPDYLNAVAAIDTHLSAEDLLQTLLDQEAVQGRQRSGRRWEARCIDLDLLLYAQLQLRTPALTVPHPGLHLRPFVVHPLAEIAPLVFIPGIGTALQVAKIVAKESLTRVCPGGDILE